MLGGRGVRLLCVVNVTETDGSKRNAHSTSPERWLPVPLRLSPSPSVLALVISLALVLVLALALVLRPRGESSTRRGRWIDW